MSLADDGLVAISDDELVEVHVTRASSTTSSRPNPTSSIFSNLLNPQGVASRARATMESLRFSMPGSGQSRRPSQPHVQLRPPHAHSQSAFPRSWTTTPDSGVIDLTVEPDSPVERRRPQPSHNSHNTHNTQQQPYIPPQEPAADSLAADIAAAPVPERQHLRGAAGELHRLDGRLSRRRPATESTRMATTAAAAAAAANSPAASPPPPRPRPHHRGTPAGPGIRSGICWHGLL
ncbi:uncharacterized protein TrAtP1_005375 [Trichoderma atroviride]|uniref:uncharacterized protein n=1 Tax=Hypocrea atroviridis TaxID=63577 RepID=UPI003316D6AF|nr:hypothetical protein TrAtP1_005375 [Trichoderma atroviride]